jgi:hypothetical protein
MVFKANRCSKGQRICVPHEVNTSNKTCVTKHQNANKVALLKLIFSFSILEISFSFSQASNQSSFIKKERISKNNFGKEEIHCQEL